MLTRSAIWILTLLSVVFISRNDAIKCYQCDDCPDKEALKEARECIKSTLSEEYKAFFSSVDENKAESDESEGSKAETIKAPKPIEVLTCHKVVRRNGTEEKVYRGCSPYLTPKIQECGSHVHQEMCLYVCEEDECNSAPISRVSAAISVCLLIAVSLFIV